MARLPDRLLAAHIAVNLVPGLTGNARRVAGAILAHFNSQTGQCDPSVERLAGMLGIDRATVLRATAELCAGAARLFDKQSHGGKSHRASYAPRWQVFRAVVAEWNGRMKDGTKVAKLRRSRSQDCDVDGRKIATQTYRRNLSKELPPAPATPAEPPAAPQRRRRQAPNEGQHWLLLPLPGKPQRAGEAAAESAKRRIDQDVRAAGSEIYLRVCEAATPQMMDEAAAEETRVRGAGAGALIAAVARAGRGG